MDLRDLGQLQSSQLSYFGQAIISQPKLFHQVDVRIKQDNPCVYAALNSMATVTQQCLTLFILLLGKFQYGICSFIQECIYNTISFIEFEQDTYLHVHTAKLTLTQSSRKQHSYAKYSG